MNYQREIAGLFAGVSAISLIWGGIMCILQGMNEIGISLIGFGTAPIQVMLGFFIGEKNGERKAILEEETA